MPRLLAFDTETSGLSIRHGCRPFFLVLQEPDKNPICYEWDMDVRKRTPIIPPEDILEIQERFQDTIAVGFNVKFDLLVLESIGVKVWDIVGWDNIHDVMLMSHAYESGGNHGLKELCIRHLGLLDDDERILGKACIEARRVAKKLRWNIARPHHPHMPMVKHFTPEKSPAWKCDMWLPRAIAQHQNRPESDPWWTLLLNYACLDGKRTMDLFLHFQRLLEEQELTEQYEKNRRLLEVTYVMESRGVTMRPAEVRKERLRFQKSCKHYEILAKQAINRPDLNLRSGEQLRDLLYKDLQLPVLAKTEKGNPSTDAETLVRLLEHVEPHVKEFLTCLIISKKFDRGDIALESYALHMIDGRVHTLLKIIGTDVNRFSSSDPNVQNVGKLAGGKEHWPEELREALKKAGVNLRRVFGPEPGYEWYAIDFGQAHPRIFAWLSGDEEAQAVFNEGRDYYIHLAAGALNVPPEKVTKAERSLFKMVNLADMYGVGDAKLEKNTGMPGLKQLLAEQFPSRALFLGKIKDSAQGKGYITTAGGYRLYCPDSHKLVNYVIIGTEAEIAKEALYNCHHYLESSRTPDYDCSIPLPVHDEIVFRFSSRDRERNLSHVYKLAEIMEDAALKHGVVIPVEINHIADGLSWYDSVRLPRNPQ